MLFEKIVMSNGLVFRGGCFAETAEQIPGFIAIEERNNPDGVVYLNKDQIIMISVDTTYREEHEVSELIAPAQAGYLEFDPVSGGDTVTLSPEGDKPEFSNIPPDGTADDPAADPAAADPDPKQKRPARAKRQTRKRTATTAKRKKKTE